MLRHPVVAVSILALTLFVTGKTAQSQNQSSTLLSSSLADVVQPSLVTVRAYDAAGKLITSGGGCFVRENVVATDYATVKDAASIKISTSRALSVTGWLFAIDQSRLLALIHTDGIKAPPLLPSGSSVAGQHAFAVLGVPAGNVDLLPVTISSAAGNAGARYFAVDAGGRQLPRGSLIVNAGANIGGIITAVDNAGPGYSYAVPAPALSQFICRTVNDVAGCRQASSGEQQTDTDFAGVGSQGMRLGQPIRRVEPAYPALAKAAGIDGQVAVEVAIDEAGYVAAARAVQGDPSLRDAAAAAAMGWRYAPPTRNGVPVKAVATLTFNFDLGARGPSQRQSGQDSPEVFRHLREVQANPQSEAAVLKLGKAYYVLSRFEEALKQFDAAVALAPGDPRAYYEAGSAHMSLGDYGDAIDALSRAVELRPDYVEALTLLAFVYNTIERYEEAIPFCRQALKYQARNPEAYHGLGWAYGGLHRFRDGIAAYKTEMEIRPYYAGAHYGLGVMYASISNFAGAIRELGQAVEINPYLAVAHSHLGMVYVATRDRASAERELTALRPLDTELARQLEDAIRQSLAPK